MDLSGIRNMFYLQLPSELTGKSQDAIDKAIPYFFLMIGMEYVYGIYYQKSALSKETKEKREIYRFNDAIISILSGIVMQHVSFWTLPFYRRLYSFFHDNYKLVDWKDDSLSLYFFLFLGIDLAYYWFHRCSHEIHLLWGPHSVHHSGEDYNVATALRQGAFQHIFGRLFYMPFALFSPPGPFAAHDAANTVYQFWFHTEAVSWLGPLEYIINTPSSHRLHHRPPGNCNYAGVLIIWDKIFGTYVQEQEKLDYYGLAKPYETFELLQANIEHYRRIVTNPAMGGWLGLFKQRNHHPFVFDPSALFRPLPPAKGDLSIIPQQSKRKKLDSNLNSITKAYILFVTAFAVGGSLAIPHIAKHFSNSTILSFQASLLFSIFCIGKLMDGDENDKYNKTHTLQFNSLRILIQTIGSIYFKLPSYITAISVADGAFFSWYTFHHRRQQRSSSSSNNESDKKKL